jgi:integrase
VDADALQEVLSEMTDAQLIALAERPALLAELPAELEAGVGTEPEDDRSHAAADELYQRILNGFRVGDGLPLPLYGDRDLPMSLLIAPFLEARGFRKATAASYRGALDRLIELLGDRPPSALTSADLERFVGALQATQSNKGARRALTPITVRKHVSHVREFLGAVAGAQANRPNPAAGLEAPAVPAARAVTPKIRPLTDEQLARLARAPILTGCADSRSVTRPGGFLCRDGRFWFAAIKLYAGVRSGEATALKTTDVLRYHGIWVIDVHIDSQTGAGNRMVPVHPVLVQMGFLDWVEHRKTLVGDGCLFEPRKYGRIWNDQILDAAGLKAEGVTVEGLRATFVEAVMARAARPLGMRLTGQAVGPARARLLERSKIEAAARIIAALEFPGLR